MKKQKKQVEKNLSSKLRPWLDEIARDLLAVGSIPMFILVAARTGVGGYYGYFYQFLFAGLILLILASFFKSENYLARTIMIYFFTVKYYNDNIFTYFATAVLILVFLSALYLKKPKKQILIGIIFGIISSAVSFFVLNPYFPLK